MREDVLKEVTDLARQEGLCRPGYLLDRLGEALTDAAAGEEPWTATLERLQELYERVGQTREGLEVLEVPTSETSLHHRLLDAFLRYESALIALYGWLNEENVPRPDLAVDLLLQADETVAAYREEADRRLANGIDSFL